MNYLVLVLLFLSSVAYAKEFKIATLYWSMNIEGQVAMRKGLEEEARKINAESKQKGGDTLRIIPYVAGDGEAGIINQVKQFHDVVSKGGIDLIIVQPTDNAALSDELKLANKKNIPVVTYDQYIIGGDIISYVTSNNYQAGELDGEYIASRFKNDREIKLILIEYPNVSSTVERIDGFIDALKKNKQKFKIVKTYNAVEPISGTRAGESILRDFPKKGSVDVIFSVNDGGGLAALDVLSKAGRHEILMATIDGDPRSIKNIRNKNMTVIDSAQFCAELGRHALRVSYKHLRGEKVAHKILIPTFPVTLETLNKYPGWLGKIPPTFVMPWTPGRKWDHSVLEYRK